MTSYLDTSSRPGSPRPSSPLSGPKSPLKKARSPRGDAAKLSQDGFTKARRGAKIAAPPTSPLSPETALKPTPHATAHAAAHDAATRSESTLQYKMDPINKQVEISYRDHLGKQCGPLLLEIKPFPDEAQMASIQGALVNIADMVIKQCPTFERFTVSGGLDTGMPAAIQVVVPGSNGLPSNRVILGGANRDAAFGKPDGVSGTAADYINRQLSELKRFISRSEFGVTVVARKRAQRAQQQGA